MRSWQRRRGTTRGRCYTTQTTGGWTKAQISTAERCTPSSTRVSAESQNCRSPLVWPLKPLYVYFMLILSWKMVPAVLVRQPKPFHNHSNGHVQRRYTIQPCVCTLHTHKQRPLNVDADLTHECSRDDVVISTMMFNDLIWSRTIIGCNDQITHGVFLFWQANRWLNFDKNFRTKSTVIFFSQRWILVPHCWVASLVDVIRAVTLASEVVVADSLGCCLQFITQTRCMHLTDEWLQFVSAASS